MDISNLIARFEADSLQLDFSEHVLETASKHVSEVDRKTKMTFKNTLDSLIYILGKPDYNCSIDTMGYKNKELVSLPTWSKGKPSQGDTSKAVKLAYWVKENVTYYLVLRHEFTDKSNLPIYYNVYLGFRKVNKRNIEGINSLKNASLENPATPNIFSKIFSWIK